MHHIIIIATSYYLLHLLLVILVCVAGHVKIRQYKAVLLKCDTCAKLSACRRQFKDFRNRCYIRRLHSLHRATYMGERLSYYARRHRAESQPNDYCSIISDGMQQSHCEIPWMGNLSKRCLALPHHIQGVIAHGR